VVSGLTVIAILTLVVSSLLSTTATCPCSPSLSLTLLFVQSEKSCNTSDTTLTLLLCACAGPAAANDKASPQTVSTPFQRHCECNIERMEAPP